MTIRLFEHRRADRIALAIAGLAALAFVLLTLFVLSHSGALQHADEAVNGPARRFGVQHPLWRSTMSAITRTGSTAYLDPAGLVACLALTWRRHWRQAAFVAVATVATLGLRLLIVVNVARPRPAGWLTSASGWSYPSGHSTAAATAATIAVIVGWPLLRCRRDRLVLTGVTGAWALAVGASRVALSVHWPSDVLGAWLLVAAIVLPIAVSMRAFPGRSTAPESSGSPPSLPQESTPLPE